MKKKMVNSRLVLYAVLLIIFVGILLRLQNFNLLPIDGHPMRQTDTESVAYNFAFKNPNILYPQNSLMRPITNVNSYFFLEFPVYQYLIGIFYMIFGWHIQVARIVNLVLYIIASLCLYYFTKKYFDQMTAFFTNIFFAFAPGSIFFIGHAIHPDVFAVTMMSISLASYVKWSSSKKVIFFLIACITLSLSVSTRPFSLIVLPAYLFMIWSLKGFIWEYFIISISSIFFYGLWYKWTKTFKEVADYSWENWVLFGQELLLNPNTILHSLISKNVTGEIIGKITSIFSAIGLVIIFIKRHLKLFFPLIWLAGVPIYWYVVPNGNIYHQYYANVYLIPLLLLAGIGANYLYLFLKEKFNFLMYPFILAVILLTLYNGKRTSAYFFNDLVSDFDLKIAEEIRDHIGPNDRLLFYQNLNSVPFSVYHRIGWVIGGPPADAKSDGESIIDLKQYGLKYIVESNRAPRIPEEEMVKLKPHIKLIYSSPFAYIYKFK